MKRVYLALILSFATVLPTLARTHGNSEYEKRENRYGYEYYYGLRLGLAIASIHSDDTALDGSNGLAGLNIGGIVGIQLTQSSPFYLEGGLHYVKKGGKGYFHKMKSDYELKYLEIPVVVKYRHELDNDMSLQPFFGGYTACGVGGKIKNYDKRDTEHSFSKSTFQRFDGGLRLGCGFSYLNLYAELSYDFGLKNISHDAFERSHTGCFYATLGVDF